VKVLDPLSRWMGYVSAVVIGLLMLVVVADVSGRYFFNNPITGASELASFMMIVVVFPALAWAALTGKHVKVDLLMARFRPRVQAIFDSVTLLAALGVFVVIVWRSILESMAVHNVTSLIRLPHAPFYWIMTLGLAVFCLSIMILMIKRIVEAGKR
jgi:TRAP-type C4-dicarboxylate transport system permease small subunit